MSATNVNRILREMAGGTQSAVDQLFPVVYGELRRLAQTYLQQERPGHTLQATALVHEVYLRLVDQTAVEWKDRAHFLATAARAMRQILVDHARRRRAQKRGGGRTKLALDEALTVSAAQTNTDLIGLDVALSKLREEQPEKAKVVELRFFGGLTAREIAEVSGISPRSVSRYWEYAQAWLYREMTSTRRAH